jgi:hypothetical protein
MGLAGKHILSDKHGQAIILPLGMENEPILENLLGTEATIINRFQGLLSYEGKLKMPRMIEVGGDDPFGLQLSN